MLDTLVQFVRDFISFLRETVDSYAEDLTQNLGEEGVAEGTHATTKYLVMRVLREIVLPSLFVALIRTAVSYTGLPPVPMSRL